MAQKMCLRHKFPKYLKLQIVIKFFENIFNKMCLVHKKGVCDTYGTISYVFEH